jgi:hypothetical protein
MSRKVIQLRWPAGVVRSTPVRDMSSMNAWPCPWSINVRLEDSLTSRMRGGSFTGQFASTVTTSRYVDLVTENGDTIVTENGDTIVLGPQYGVATGDGRVFVAPGDSAPASSTADCLYRDRLFRVSGGIILCSRQGDYTNWDYGGELEDTGRAMVLQLSEAGEIGESVVALVPHKDSYLLCFTAAETWILSGDPTTGSLRNVSREVGIIAARAWCKANDTCYFLSSLGLYSVSTDGGGLRSVSDAAVPYELTGITNSDCVLDYEHASRGVYIHLLTSPSWFYDIEHDQFWPFDLSEPNSHVLFGPFQLGEGRQYGRLLNIMGNVATSSADVTWHIVPGDTAEEAAANGKAAITAYLASTSYSSYVHSSGTWVAGQNHMSYPRTHALWCCVWLSAASAWAFETASLESILSGGWR